MFIRVYSYFKSRGIFTLKQVLKFLLCLIFTDIIRVSLAINLPQSSVTSFWIDLQGTATCSKEWLGKGSAWFTTVVNYLYNQQKNSIAVAQMLWKKKCEGIIYCCLLEIMKKSACSLPWTRELNWYGVWLKRALSKNTPPLMKKYQIKGSMTCLLCSLSVLCSKHGLRGCVQRIYTVNLFETPIKTKSVFLVKTWYWGQGGCTATQIHLQSNLILKAQQPG